MFYLWAVTVCCHENFQFFNGQILLRAVLGLDALLCVKVIHGVALDDALFCSVVEGCGEHAKVAICCVLTDGAWLAMFDVRVGEVAQELHIATAKVGIDLFEGNEEPLCLFKIFLHGVKHFHTAVKS